MSGKRLLDFAALFNACRGVAHKHIALRTRQVEVYNRTSTLARVVRNQTDRVTETAKAASFLVSRLNESAPAWASEAREDGATGRSQDGTQIPSRGSTEPKYPARNPKTGLEQDHFYQRSQQNSAMDEQPEDDLDITQEQADNLPLPDGTIPPKEVRINTPTLDHTNASPRTKDKLSKTPLKSYGLEPASSIPTLNTRPLSAVGARIIQRQSELQIPSKTADALGETAADPLGEGHDADSFYQKPRHTSPSLSSLPRVKIPKRSSDIQEGDGAINSDSYYKTGGLPKSEKVPSPETVLVQEQLAEDTNTEIFYSPRVARMLGGGTYTPKGSDLQLKWAKGTSIEHASLEKSKGQDVLNGRNSSLNDPAISSAYSVLMGDPNKRSGDVKKPATDVFERTKQKSETSEPSSPPQLEPYELRESKVPSSRLGRLWNYGGLAAGMFGGAISESLRRVSGSGGEGSYMLSAGNMDRLVTKLSRMRGAALKLGQVISFQDSKMLPPAIQEVLQRVQDRADYMPASQRNKVLAANLGPDWRDMFSSFEEKPLAAASIGQVHGATLKSNGVRVAVKVQYPGVADSIDSDLSNLAVLLTASRLLPKGLFLDKTIANARVELAWECDYIREAECGRRFEGLLADDKDAFAVPKIYPEASGKQVLTMEFMHGVGVTRVQNLTQEQKDWIGTQILRLCLREITEFKYMQTDPNWTNFLYNVKTTKLELLDFGASREYPDAFIVTYSKLLIAASKTDKDTIRDLSVELGYLTGHESKAMLNAHIASVLTLAEPFLDSSPELYDFRDQTITDRVKALIPVMIRQRLSPPPEETYSLHRKLSGAFLLCARLGSRVRCRQLFQDSMMKAELL